MNSLFVFLKNKNSFIYIRICFDDILYIFHKSKISEKQLIIILIIFSKARRFHMKSYKFTFNKKDYDNPYYDLFIDNECDRIANLIVKRDSSRFSNVLGDVANKSTNIDAIVLKLMSNGNIQDFIDIAIHEFNLEPEKDKSFNSILRMATQSVHLLFCKQLHVNADIIAQNALISYVNRLKINLKTDYKRERIKEFIENYIEDALVDLEGSLDSIIDNFESELLLEFDIEIVEARK